MAGTSERDHEHRLPVKVWTFLVRGGPDDLSISLPGNPPLHHTGSMTIWKLVGTQETADAATGLLRSLGASVEVFTEEESQEQRAERMRLLGR